MKIFSLSIALFFISFSCYSQVSLSGTIVNENSNQVVEFASIYIEDLSTGTSSNINGEFVLKLKELPAKIIVSHINFEKIIILINKPKDCKTIKLTPKSYSIPEVTIGSNKAYFYIDMAIEVMRKNEGNLNTGRAFYRQLTKNDTTFTEVHEIFYDISYNNRGVNKYNLFQGRYGIVDSLEENSYINVSNFSYITLGFRSYVDTLRDVIIPLCSLYKSYYDVSLKKVHKNSKGSSVAEIEFKAKKNIVRPIVVGSLFIDVDKYYLLKLNGSIYNNLGMTVAKKRSSTTNFIYSLDINYFISDNNEILLDYMKVNLDFDFSVKKQFNRHISVSSYLFMYEHSTSLNNENLKPVNKNIIDVRDIENTAYDPFYWENNPIVKRNPLEEKVIQSFEKNKIFGNYLKNKNE